MNSHPYYEKLDSKFHQHSNLYVFDPKQLKAFTTAHILLGIRLGAGKHYAVVLRLAANAKKYPLPHYSLVMYTSIKLQEFIILHGLVYTRLHSTHLINARQLLLMHLYL